MKFSHEARLIRIAFLAVTWVAIGVSATPAVTRSQTTPTRSLRAEAVVRRNAGDFAGALALLRSHLKAYPNDGDAIRMLAETLYWVKDFEGSRAVHEQALTIHPADSELRLQYARMLIEIGDANRAREVVSPVTSNSTGGRADAILGTLAYWEGDLSEADRLISRAIASGDTDPGIRKIHADIAVLTSPWVRVAPEYFHDDQPISRTGASAEAGWFPTPSTSVSINGQGLRFQLGDTATRNASLGGFHITHYFGSAQTEMSLSAGAVTRSFASTPDFTGEFSAAVRMPAHTKIGGRVSREPYFSSAASLSQAVMTNTGIAYFRLDDPRGWLGEAAYQLQRYADSNTLTSTYGWLMAPLVHTADAAVRIGYSESLQNSSETRFTLADAKQPYAPADSRYDLSGEYAPYYTPIDLRRHSAIGAATFHLGPSATLTANGAYAFRATETSPSFIKVMNTSFPSTTAVVLSSFQRTFNPWDAHASLELNPSSSVGIVVNAGMFKTGFYTASSASIALVFRLADRAIRKAGGY